MKSEVRYVNAFSPRQLKKERAKKKKKKKEKERRAKYLAVI